MQKIQSILVIVDRNDEEHPELDRAAILAKQFNAKVHLFVREFNASLYLHYAFSKKGDRLSRESYERAAQSWADKQIAVLAAQGIEATAEASWQRHLFSTAMEIIREHKPDLVVRATRHDSHLHRTFFNLTDWELMRNCPAPLLLVQQTAPQNGAVLCAVNPGHAQPDHALLDKQIMAAGTLLADKLDQPLHVFNCFEIPPEPLRAPAGIDATVLETYRRETEATHQELFEDFISDYSLPADRVHRLNGMPDELLPELAKKLPASLVIMGVVSRSALPSLLIGHTAESVLDQIDSDVLVIKHPAVHD